MRQQRGVVLIMVLWTAVVLTVLVTVLATQVRLAANTAFHHRSGSEDLAALQAAFNQAEMELMLERMPIAVDQELILNDEGEFRIPAYRFNGQPLSLHYPLPENTTVRIFDHAGKININRIPRQRLQQLIEKQLGEQHDPRDVQALLAAWSDWTDRNNLLTPGGAEDEYYQSLDPPYPARNLPDLDSVEEILLIRGFDEVFGNVNLNAAMTVYGTASVLNPNLATREALLLLPGLDEELVERIIAYRQVRDIRTMRELGDIIPLERMVEVSPWLGFNTSSVYSVYAYLNDDEPDTAAGATDAENEAAPPVARQAYRQILEVRDYQSRARVFTVQPYAQLPDVAPARADDPGRSLTR